MAVVTVAVLVVIIGATSSAFRSVLTTESAPSGAKMHTRGGVKSQNTPEKQCKSLFHRTCHRKWTYVSCNSGMFSSVSPGGCFVC
jgi:hypothetical protein